MFPLLRCVEPAAAVRTEDVAPSPASAGDAAVVNSGGGTPEDLIAWFNSTVQEYDAFFLVYYRGLW